MSQKETQLMFHWWVVGIVWLVVKCQTDWKNGTLANGMQYVLIQDKAMDMAKVSLRVAAGHSTSPEELPALAYIVAKTLLCSNGQESSEPFNEFLNRKEGIYTTLVEEERAYFQFQVPIQHLDQALMRYFMFL
ncbi:metalloprotease [Entomophthora muscae]|uniref:Metalloprotease n=1 Tax=Entomophthora muscae TaxID=34485 RepID=A0ACC2SKP8_9FUNG|nr:metalloprotease [Entomophthora muscae]